MPWRRPRTPIQKLLVPISDLGLTEMDVGTLDLPADVPLVLAVQVVQTASGPRIVQYNPNATGGSFVQGKTVLRLDTTEGAGNTGPIAVPPAGGYAVIVEILALTGAPTNIKYRGEFTIDGGTTWYKGADATVTTTGVVSGSLGLNASNPSAGNDILATFAMVCQIPDFYRISWVFTAGTAPTVRHRITGLSR